MFSVKKASLITLLIFKPSEVTLNSSGRGRRTQNYLKLSMMMRRALMK